MDGNKRGNTRDKQRVGEWEKAGKRRLFESGAGGCKQARSRSRGSSKNKKMSRRRGCVPPIMISAFAVLRSKVQTLAAGSNKQGHSKQIMAGGYREERFRPAEDGQ
jgi:hypothetical protein